MQQPKIIGYEEDPFFEINSADAEAVYFKTIEGVSVPKPVLTKLIWPGPRGTIFEHTLSKGQVLPPHVHHSEFINFLIRGNVAVTLGGHRYEATKWDTWTALPGVEHSVEALEDSALIDFMIPPAVVTKDSFLTWNTSIPNNTHVFTRYADAPEVVVESVEGAHVDKAMYFAKPQKFLVRGPNVSMNLAHCVPGKRAWHTHWHTWFCYMVEGEFKVWMAGREFDAPAGHYFGAPPGAEHANYSPDHSVVLDFKWPPPQAWHGRLRSWEAPTHPRNRGD